MEKPSLHTRHQLLEMRFGHLVIDAAAFPLAGKKTATLHQTKMLGGDVVGNLAVFRELADGVATVQQQLDDPQSHRVGERLQAFGSIGKGLHAAGRLRHGGVGTRSSRHVGFLTLVFIYRNLTRCFWRSGDGFSAFPPRFFARDADGESFEEG